MTDRTRQQINDRLQRQIEQERPKAEQMRRYIDKHQCSIRHAAIELNICPNTSVYDFARRHEISSYRRETRSQRALREKHFGLWKVEAILPRRKTANSIAPMVRCLCRGCGKRFRVQVDHLIDKRSQGCRDCRLGADKRKSVVCVDSKSHYSSVAKAAQAEDVPYSTLKYKLSRSDPGSIVKTKDGKRFRLAI